MCLSLPFLLLLHQLWIQGNLLQFRFSKFATQKIPQEFPLQICFLLSSTSFLVHMFCICLGACVRASSSPAHSLRWRSLENWVFFVKWSITCRLYAPRDLILYRKRSVSVRKALGKLPAALRDAILPSSDGENGRVWARETKSFLANLHWDSKWKKSVLDFLWPWNKKAYHHNSESTGSNDKKRRLFKNHRMCKITIILHEFIRWEASCTQRVDLVRRFLF